MIGPNPVARRKTPSSIREQEFQLQKRKQTFQFALGVIRTVVWSGAIVWCFALAMSAIRAMAGQTTVADLALEVAGNLSVNVTLAWTAAVGGTIYGLWERWLRSKSIRKMAPRLRKLERKIDPKRSSSGLNPKDDPPAGV